MLLQRGYEAASGELGGNLGLPKMKSYNGAFPGLSVVKNRKAACLPSTSGPRGPAWVEGFPEGGHMWCSAGHI